LITSTMRASRRTQGQASTQNPDQAKPYTQPNPHTPVKTLFLPRCFRRSPEDETVQGQAAEARERPRFTHIHNVKQQRVEPHHGIAPMPRIEDLTLIASFWLPSASGYPSPSLWPALPPKAWRLWADAPTIWKLGCA
jgi:hypothetical protein